MRTSAPAWFVVYVLAKGLQLSWAAGLTFSSFSLFLSLFLSFPNSSSWLSLPPASASIQPAWYRRCSRSWWTLPEPHWGPLQPRRHPSLLPLPQAPLPGLWSPREPVPPRLARKALHRRTIPGSASSFAMPRPILFRAVARLRDLRRARPLGLPAKRWLRILHLPWAWLPSWNLPLPQRRMLIVLGVPRARLSELAKTLS